MFLGIGVYHTPIDGIEQQKNKTKKLCIEQKSAICNPLLYIAPTSELFLRFENPFES